MVQLNDRLKKIIDIVRKNQPITGEAIAKELNLTRATLRPDLAILTMSGILTAKPKVGYFYLGMESNQLVAKRLQEVIVEDVMSLPVIVSEDTSTYNTIVTMFLNDVGSIIVCANGYLAGIISRKDLLKQTIGNVDIHNLPVALVMTRMPNVITTTPKETVVMAAKKMIDHEVDSLPVVEKEIVDGVEKYRVLGRITKTTITKLFVELALE